MTTDSPGPGLDTAQPEARQPLAGLRILEVSDTPSAAFATVLLADMGATVIVCEPIQGSLLRRLGPRAVQSIWWPIIARNKFSLALDFDDPASVNTLSTLLAECDLVVRDRSIPMLDRARDLACEFPQDLLITPTGADRPAIWPWSTAPELSEAASGLMALTGLRDNAPRMPEIPLASHTTAMLAAAVALFERRAAHRSGRAPYPLAFAMHEALMRMIEWQLPVAQAQGRAELRNGNRFPMNSNIGNIFRTADGTLLTISAAAASVAERLLGLIGGDTLRSDPRFSGTQARSHHMDELEALISDWMSQRTGREAIEQMRAQDTVVGTIDDIGVLLSDPHLSEREAFIRVDHEGVPLIMPSPLPRMEPPGGQVKRTGGAPGADKPDILGLISRGESPWAIGGRAQEGSGSVGIPRRAPTSIDVRPVAPEPAVRSDNVVKTTISSGAARPLPLKGLRVLELGSVIAAPFAASLLADMGAEVIKIERPEGDALRNMGLRDEGVPLWWGVASRAKRLGVMDLKTEEDRARFLSLIDRADVFIENNRPGVLERLGLGWDTLRDRNPALVMLSISGFGQSGPYARRPGFGKIAEAMSGTVALTGEPEQVPLHVGFSLADTAAGLAGVLGIAQVLHERDVSGTGRGRRIDLALYDPLLRVNECQAALMDRLGCPPRRTGSSDPWSFGASGSEDRRVVGAQCADGYWLVAIADAAAIASLRRAGHVSVEELARLGSRPEVLLRLKTLGIEAAPVHDGLTIGCERYFVERGDVREVIDRAGRTRRVPGVAPRAYDDPAIPGFDAQDIDPENRSIDWL